MNKMDWMPASRAARIKMAEDWMHIFQKTNG